MPTDKVTPDADSSSDPWREVGQQFESLGQSLSAAFQKLQHDEATRQAMNDVASGLKTMAQAVSNAVDEAAASPEGQKFRADAERAVDSAAKMGQEAVSEARPKLLAALESMRAGLQSAIAELRGGDEPPES